MDMTAYKARFVLLKLEIHAASMGKFVNFAIRRLDPKKMTNNPDSEVVNLILTTIQADIYRMLKELRKETKELISEEHHGPQEDDIQHGPEYQGEGGED